MRLAEATGNSTSRGLSWDAGEVSVPRTLFEVLTRLRDERAEGELVVRERCGAVHRVVLRAGRPVAAKVRGRFDPLLTRLRALGALDDDGHRRALGQLACTERRAGEVARSLGATPTDIERALAAQLRAALEALTRRVDGTPATYTFEPRRVEASEIAAWTEVVPAGSTRPERPGTGSRTRIARNPPLDRDTFRRLARALHPDRAQGLSERERAENERALAELTARWHGLA